MRPHVTLILWSLPRFTAKLFGNASMEVRHEDMAKVWHIMHRWTEVYMLVFCLAVTFMAITCGICCNTCAMRWELDNGLKLLWYMRCQWNRRRAAVSRFLLVFQIPVRLQLKFNRWNSSCDRCYKCLKRKGWSSRLLTLDCEQDAKERHVTPVR